MKPERRLRFTYNLISTRPDGLTPYAVVLILLGVGLCYLRIRQVRRREEAERMAAYGRMVAGIAHDVRNPLFALQTAAYVIEDMVQPEGEVRQQLDVVQKETERLNTLMEDLLYFVEPKPLRLAPTRIEELLKEAVETYQVEHNATFPKIVLTLTPSLPLIPLDRDRLVRALVNLIENAAKHAKGMSTVTLSAKLAPDSPKVKGAPSRVCIRVANDGAGIDPKILPKIFDPFFTTGRGLGLGLAIVQEIVKRHGGTITVESQPETGTVFKIYLPTKQPTRDAEHAKGDQ